MAFNFDVIIEEVGGAGKYQALRYIILSCIPICMSWHLLGNQILAAKPDQECIPNLYNPDDVSFSGVELSPDFQCARYGIDYRPSAAEDEKKLFRQNRHLNSFRGEVLAPTIAKNERLLDNAQFVEKLFTMQSATSYASCSQVNYNLYTSGWDNTEKSSKVCTMLYSVLHERNVTKFVGKNSTTLINMFLHDYKEPSAEELENTPTLEQYSSCQGFNTSTQWYTKTITTDFNLYCANEWKIKMIQVGVMIGVFFGAVLFGKMSDTMGRRPCIMYALITCFTGMLCSSFVPANETGYWLLFLLRGLNGAGSIGAISSSFVLTSEIFEPKSRVMALQVAQALFGVGQAFLAILAYYIRDWRWLGAVLALPTAVGFFVPMFMDESARWLILNNRKEEAIAVLNKIAKTNGKSFKGLGDDAGSDEKDSVETKTGMTDLFKTPRIRARTLNLFFQWFMLSGVYYGLSMNAASLGSNPYVVLAISGLLEVPAELLAGVLFMKIGRRWSMFIFNFFGGFFCMAMMFVDKSLGPGHKMAALILPLAGKFALTGGYGGIYVYSAELFPTALRNSGIGLCSAVARIGGIAAPIVGMLPGVYPYIIFGVIGLIGAALTLLLEEVLDKELPDTVAQGEEFGKGEPSAIEDLLIMVRSLCRTDYTPVPNYKNINKA